MLQRRGTAAQWAAADPVLGDGEMGIDKTNAIIKIGDGVTPWSQIDLVYDADPAVLTVFGRAGDVTATSADLEDRTDIGAALFTADSAEDVRVAAGATEVGSAVLTVETLAALLTFLGFTNIGATVMSADTVEEIRTLIGAGTGNGNVVGTGITQIRKVTQSEFDAIAVKDGATLYAIGT
jgi:hypothetical protein